VCARGEEDRDGAEGLTPTTQLIFKPTAFSPASNILQVADSPAKGVLPAQTAQNVTLGTNFFLFAFRIPPLRPKRPSDCTEAGRYEIFMHF
jgi:hypothetical protein